MREKLEAYLRLSKVFSTHQFHLYLVGGCVRDTLLKKEFTDVDLATDATPEEISKFFPDVDLTFSKYGSTRLTFDEQKFEITTLRIEKGYGDSRHPTSIKFTKDLKKDVVRRDFTINGLYFDDRFILYDYVKGQKDIEKHLIRAIGKPTKRFIEDPLRIIRAVRFALTLDFEIENKTSKAMIKCAPLLIKLKPEKIKEEVSKITCDDVTKRQAIFDKYNISQFINM